MKVFCMECNKVHELTALEVEKVLYVGVGMLSDAASDLTLPNPKAYSTLPAKHGWFPCLNQALAMAGDIEDYSEFVETCLESRRELSKKRTEVTP